MPKRTAKRQRLTLYSVSRCYGGPEEGGWWYDWAEPTTHSWRLPANVTPVHLRKLQEQFRARFKWTNRSNRYSVLGGDDAAVYLEDYKGQYRSRQRPHYE